MARLGTWRQGRKRERVFPSAWVWVMVAVVMVMTTMVGGDPTPLYPSSGSCSKGKSTTLPCTLPPGGKDYRLISFDWEDYTEVSIIANGNKVALEKPLCRIKPMKVQIYNASRVITENKGENCSLQLVLHDCRDVTIDSGVDLVRMTSSEANKVILPRVSQFDLTNSTVGEVSLTVDGRLSTLKYSTIGVVSKLEVNGTFVLNVESSKLGRVENFVYGSTTTNSVLQDVEVDTVLGNGFKVVKGQLTLRNFKAESVEPEGIQVWPHTKLIVEYSEVKSVFRDSIFVYNKSILSLKHVTFGPNPNVSFTLSESSISLFPLSFLYGPPVLPFTWITLAVIFGLLVGASTGAAIMYYMIQKRRYMRSEVDTSGLLGQEPSTHTNNFSPPKTSNKFQPTAVPHSRPVVPEAPKRVLPEAPSRPLPNVPSGVNEQEVYEEYIDVAPRVPNQKSFPAGMAQARQDVPKEVEPEEVYEEYVDVAPKIPAQKGPETGPPLRMPFPLPNESSSTSLGIKDKPLPNPKTRPPPPKRANYTKQDDRDHLPPPPLPYEEGEEIYDELEPVTPSRPLPPPTTNKPKAPLFPRKPLPPLATGKPKKY